MAEKKEKQSGGLAALVSIVGLVSQIYTNKVDEEQKRINDAALVRATKQTAIATIVIAIFGIFSFFAVVGQAIIFSWQLHIFEKADQTTRESFTAVQRAFVFARGLNIDTAVLPGYWTFSVTVENSGNTPTKELEYLTISNRASAFDPEDEFKRTPKDLYGHEPTLNQRRSGDLIGPKSQFVLLGSETGLPHSSVIQMATDRTNYYVRGFIRYRDVFRETEEHVTKFCFATVPYKDGSDVKVSYSRCLYWNCADSDCKADRERFDRDMRALTSRKGATQSTP